LPSSPLKPLPLRQDELPVERIFPEAKPIDDAAKPVDQEAKPIDHISKGQDAVALPFAQAAQPQTSFATNSTGDNIAPWTGGLSSSTHTPGD
jgi:hypothetical protein